MVTNRYVVPLRAVSMTPDEVRKHLLLVEDDADAAEALSILLELKGYSISRAENGLEALERLRSDRSIALVILDLMMPVMDGITFLRHLEADPRLSKVSVIVASATTPALPVKVETIMRKPIDFDTLLLAVEKTFSAVQMQPPA
jgi:CheY-like chemotaxis protein